ncbi:cytochrome c oxidase assembly protein [Abyssibacter profundi]|nr:cytochrome c oxidase assembly protein [Abyssibacter profundi]
MTEQRDNSTGASWWLAGKLFGITAVMFAFGFALVPLYEVVCEITGFNGQNEGLTLVSSVEEAPVDDRVVRVEFLTSVHSGLDWSFSSERDSIDVHPGKLYTVTFTAANHEGRAMVGQARPSVAPWQAAKHLRKTECFCFDQQPMEAGEEKLMPVRFMVDPELPDSVDTVTLSYTFFEVQDVAQAN